MSRLMIAPGARVSEGQPIMELETDKAVVEVPSSVNDSAAVVVASVSGTNMIGTYAGRAQLGASPSVQLGGSFNIVYTRGRSPINIGDRMAPLQVSGTKRTPDTGPSRR